MKLFISYRSLDSVKVDTIVSRLRNMQPVDGIPNFVPWQDKYGIVDGHDWWEAIVNAIIDCDVFVFMVSRESVQNVNCRAELNYARRRNRPILPIVLEGEYFYNATTGKNDIDYWEDLPDELNDIRAQFLFYEGTSFVQRLTQAVKLYQLEPQRWRDIPAERPQDPRLTADETNNSDVLYDEACDYAWRTEFVTAEKLFQKLINRNTQFANEAETWIRILREYETLLRFSRRKNLYYKLIEKWTVYETRFPLPYLELFDPNKINQLVKNLTTHITQLPKFQQSKTDYKSRQLVLEEEISQEQIAHSLTAALKSVPQAHVKQSDDGSSQSQMQYTDELLKSENILESENIQIHPLTGSNPFDWLRLLIWLMLAPNQLEIHQEIYGDGAERQTGSWLVATNICVPVLLVLLPTILNSEIAHTLTEQHNITSSFIVSLIIGTVGVFFATGILDQSEMDKFPLIVIPLFLSIAIGIALILAYFVIGDNSESKMLIIAFFVVTGIIFGLVFENIFKEDISVTVAGKIGSALLMITQLIFSFGLAVGIGLFAVMNLVTDISSVVVFVAITGVLAFFLGGLPPIIWTSVGTVRLENIKRSKVLFWNYVISAVLVISYVVLIWSSVALSVI